MCAVINSKTENRGKIMCESKPIVLEVCDLIRYYNVKNKQVRAVDGITFAIKQEETFGLIGESGCGKSTLSQLLIGLQNPTAGEIRFHGEKLSYKNRKNLCKKIQMIFQDPYSSLDPRMTVEKIVGEPLRIHTKLKKKERQEKVLEALKQVGLGEEDMEKYPYQFSGGQCQRINIARALVLKPEFLICDEPVSALDVSLQAQILNLFTKMKEEYHLTCLFISHDMSVVKHMSDRIAVMYLGKIVEIAPRDQLFASTLHPYTQMLMDAIPIPDPSLRQTRTELLGEIPNPMEIQEGCPFSGRCPKVMKKCKTDRPPVHKASGEHYVVCHLYGSENEK